MAGGDVVLGMVLALAGAIGIAFSMVMQRWALSYPEDRVPLCGLRLPRLVAWFIGILVYAAANGFYAAALNFGPLSLLAGIFTTLLVFNMIFARFLLREELTPPKIAGSTLILLGVILCVIAAPSDPKTDFSADDIEDLAAEPAGAIYVVLLISAVLSSVVAILVYEYKYPISHTPVAVISGGNSGDTAPGDSDVQAATSGDHQLPAASAGREARNPPRWLDRVMGLVYPGSLGLDEGVAHLTMKATISMWGLCWDGEGTCSHWALYVGTSLWVASSVATLWWLHRVFERYETTLALPIEYGTVNAASVCSGLIFYQEHEAMKPWQIVFQLCGLVVILSGLQCGRMQQLPFQTAPSGSSSKMDAPTSKIDPPMEPAIDIASKDGVADGAVIVKAGSGTRIAS